MQSLGLNDLSLVNVNDGVHDIHDLVVDDDLVLLKILLLLLPELILLVLVVAQDLYVVEEVQAQRVDQHEGA